MVKVVHEEFLTSTDVIDWRHDRILALAKQLSAGRTDQQSIAKAVFEWVRDEIEHSVDFDRSEVTCVASDVLAQQTGFCFAKSHLTAALMRANGIPTGFCYQRLSMNGSGAPYCLHGLNAVFLDNYGWYRIDARGNTETIRTEFTPPTEQLAFASEEEGEFAFPDIRPSPLSIVIDALEAASSVRELASNLPDISVSDSEN